MKYIDEVMSNKALWIAIMSWAVAQAIKVVLELIQRRRVNISLFVSSGGMPSSHSSFVTAISTAIGITEGFNTSMFAVSAILSLVVMYDAAGVRRAAGKQAEVLNMIIKTFEDSGITLDKKLKELLGHTPVEVAAGAVLGILIAVLCL